MLGVSGWESVPAPDGGAGAGGGAERIRRTRVRDRCRDPAWAARCCAACRLCDALHVAPASICATASHFCATRRIFAPCARVPSRRQKGERQQTPFLSTEGPERLEPVAGRIAAVLARDDSLRHAPSPRSMRTTSGMPAGAGAAGKVSPGLRRKVHRVLPDAASAQTTSPLAASRQAAPTVGTRAVSCSAARMQCSEVVSDRECSRIPIRHRRRDTAVEASVQRRTRRVTWPLLSQ